MRVFSIVKLLPLGTMDGLMHYCTWSLASYNSALGSPSHLVNNFDYAANRNEITV